ncbi:hypothetical protein CY34DRAFT_431769 [Suillus luteus UH-Slu-Lm8-n1]|uniref:Uncharacterized protein n=1 Tax=Suillus luteus UH-Slu-Lm8-n1 TaxID=930992 RepID=A0A0D0BHG2_9AGAM|nr:hypothetical protein CY34DRAFT_431769 [Suillus luteus UH-Slu-Lm8-n1]
MPSTNFFPSSPSVPPCTRLSNSSLIAYPIFLSSEKYFQIHMSLSILLLALSRPHRCKPRLRCFKLVNQLTKHRTLRVKLPHGRQRLYTHVNHNIIQNNKTKTHNVPESESSFHF